MRLGLVLHLADPRSDYQVTDYRILQFVSVGQSDSGPHHNAVQKSLQCFHGRGRFLLPGCASYPCGSVGLGFGPQIIEGRLTSAHEPLARRRHRVRSRHCGIVSTGAFYTPER